MVKCKILDPRTLHYDMSLKYGKQNDVDVASLSCQILVVSTQENTPPNLRDHANFKHVFQS